MKIHLLLTCLAYMYFGFGFAIQKFGIQAGLSLELVITVFTTSVIFFVIIVFTSMQKVKDGNGSTMGKFNTKPTNHICGKTARSERESFKNIKTKEKAGKILSKRNKSEIQFATLNNKVIYPIIELK